MGNSTNYSFMKESASAFPWTITKKFLIWCHWCLFNTLPNFFKTSSAPRKTTTEEIHTLLQIQAILRGDWKMSRQSLFLVSFVCSYAWADVYDVERLGYLFTDLKNINGFRHERLSKFSIHLSQWTFSHKILDRDLCSKIFSHLCRTLRWSG